MRGALAVALVAAAVAALAFAPGAHRATFAGFHDEGASADNVLAANLSAEPACDAPGPDVYGYTCTPILHRFEDLSGDLGASTLLLADDAVAANVSLGFAFPYYGGNFTHVNVSSDGFLALGEPGAAGCCAPAAIPDAALPDGLVAAFWGDLDPSAVAASVKARTLGEPGAQRFVLQFTDVPPSGGGNASTFQVVLWEGNGTIHLNYRNVTSDGAVRSAGIEAPGGGDGLQYRFAALAKRGKTIEFTRP